MTERKGFKSPNHTQVPNDLFDQYLPEMGKAELKVVLALVRATLGFHRRKVRLSLSDLQGTTGLGRRHVLQGADEAIERGLVTKNTDGGVTIYTIRWLDDDGPDMGGGGGSPREPVVTLGNRGGVKREPPSNKESSKERDIAADGGESLDDVFGERPETDGPVSPFEGMTDDEKVAHILKSGGRKFDNAPAHLTEILEEMIRVQVKVFDRDMYKDQRGQFLKAAKTFYERYGSGMIGAYEDAARMHKQEGLAYNGPQSVLWAVDQLIHKDRKPPKSAQETSQVWAT